ncbi:MATE family efflux transporter [Plebeiibacterium marinum]|uniref:Multidrug-efflux transporter n=1 Tax=Plebeiibacterium marinum TaxID=2992111 RepID=A0AAE3MC31_9BACT|nr:MATE family efflux transporter [Plebeiobacterium marinum]MCW3804973.1 MATE family efflux transporter [Plebeiobacterium marinum]
MKRFFLKSYYSNYRPHYIPNIKLALPVVFSQGGQMVVGLADTVMVGRLGATELAAVSFANGIFILGLVLSIGVAYGLTPLVGKAFGAGNRELSAQWLKQGLVANVLFAVGLMFLMFLVGLLTKYMGQAEEVVSLARPYYYILVLSVFPYVIFLVFKQFAEGITNTRIAMVITLVANVLNIVLNYIFIFGKLGFPSWGLDGAGYATLVSRIVMGVLFVAAFVYLPFFNKYKRDCIGTRIQWTKVLEVIKVGFPIGGQMVIEVFAFSMGTLMMGWIDKDSLAAHQIVLSLASLTYMMSVGLSSAATIKVSNYFGANDFHNLKYSAYAIIHKVIIFMAFNGVMFVLLRNELPRLFINDVNVVSIAAQLMVVAGVFQLFDGLQVTWLGILRGLQDVNAPSVIAFVTWILIALPISYLCAFVFEMNAVGIWIGYLIGLFVASFLLQIRYRKLYQKFNKYEC